MWTSVSLSDFILILWRTKALALAIASIMKVAVMKLMKARKTSSRVPRRRPARLNALGRASGPAPRIRLNM